MSDNIQYHNWKIYPLESKHSDELLKIEQSDDEYFLDAFGKKISFNGNKNIKKSDTKLKLNKYHIEEIAKCANDFHYFLFNYCKVLTVGGYNTPTFRPYQERMIFNFLSNTRIVFLAGRQTGKSVTSALWVLWLILFNFSCAWGFAANKSSLAAETLAKLKITFEHLPIWLQQGVKVWNSAKIVLENMSTVQCSTMNKNSFRGMTFAGNRSGCFCDECAWIDPVRWGEFVDSVLPTVASDPNSQIVMGSTPNGLNHWWDIVKNARTKSNGYSITEVKWNEPPGRDDKFKAKVIKEAGKLNWYQNYECSFIGSSTTLIAGYILEKLKPVEPIEDTGSLRIFEKPIKNRNYIILVDLASGTGADYYAINIIKMLKNEFVQVAIFHDNETNKATIPRLIEQLAKQYNNAYVLFEINYGEEIASRLYYDLEYENVITVAKSKKGQIPFGFSGTLQLGLKQNKKTKPESLTQLKTLLENNKLILKDSKSINEFYTFIAVGQSYEADLGKHDDIVMSLALFAWLTLQESFIDIHDNTLNSELDGYNQSDVESILPASLFGSN